MNGREVLLSQWAEWILGRRRMSRGQQKELENEAKGSGIEGAHGLREGREQILES